MAAVPLLAKAAMGAFVLATIWWAVFGPPPDRRDVGLARLWAITSLVLYVTGLYAWLSGQAIGPVLVGAGVLALCLAFWHARGDDGGGGGGDDDDDGDGPIDWDRFDRARRDWDRPLVSS